MYPMQYQNGNMFTPWIMSFKLNPLSNIFYKRKCPVSSIIFGSERDILIYCCVQIVLPLCLIYFLMIIRSMIDINYVEYNESHTLKKLEANNNEQDTQNDLKS